MKVRDVMTRAVESLPPDATIPRIAATMRDKDVGAIPIVENEKCLGVVTDRDVVVRGIAGSNGSILDRPATELMSRNVISCKASQDLQEVTAHMRTAAVRRLIVVDDGGHLIGMLSLGDIATNEECNAGGALGEITQA